MGERLWEGGRLIPDTAGSLQFTRTSICYTITMASSNLANLSVNQQGVWGQSFLGTGALLA